MTFNKENKELKELEQYIVKYPDNEMIDATISTLRQYVPEKRRKSMIKYDRFTTFLKQAKPQIQFIHPMYWIVSIVLFALGYLITNQLESDPTLTLIIIAPLPFIFGLVEVFRGRDSHLIEMELTCKFSAFEVILTRLLIISVFNFGLTLMLTFVMSTSTTQDNLFKMLLIWLGPLTLFITLALFLSTRFRGVQFVPIFLSIWVMFTLLLVSDISWQEKLITFDLSFHLTLLMIGIVLVSLQVRSVINKFVRYQEGEIFETSY
ncbi:MAG TPA: hypothetical protein GXZ58_07505 [Bacilli bacterium]|nr:hypothetical protein [Bacilli bacterium]